MTTEELKDAMLLVRIDEPCLLLVDSNKVDLDALMGSSFPRLNRTVLMVGVDGTPEISKLGINDLRKALAILEER